MLSNKYKKERVIIRDALTMSNIMPYPPEFPLKYLEVAL